MEHGLSGWDEDDCRDAIGHLARLERGIRIRGGERLLREWLAFRWGERVADEQLVRLVAIRRFMRDHDELLTQMRLLDPDEAPEDALDARLLTELLRRPVDFPAGREGQESFFSLDGVLTALDGALRRTVR